MTKAWTTPCLALLPKSLPLSVRESLISKRMVSIPIQFVPCTLPTPSLGNGQLRCLSCPCLWEQRWGPVWLLQPFCDPWAGGCSRAGGIAVFPVCGAAGPTGCCGRLWPRGQVRARIIPSPLSSARQGFALVQIPAPKGRSGAVSGAGSIRIAAGLSASRGSSSGTSCPRFHSTAPAPEDDPRKHGWSAGQ